MQDSLTSLLGQLKDHTGALGVVPVLGDPDDRTRLIVGAVGIREIAERVVVAAVQQSRRDQVSWQEIGEALGVTRQAAFQRYGKPVDPRTGAPMDTKALPEAANLATTVIEDLAAGRWAEIAARFDAAMTGALSTDALAAAWAQIAAQAGKFEGHGEPEAVRTADLTITNTPLAFEAGDYTARVTFRDDQSIAGLYILNPKSA